MKRASILVVVALAIGVWGGLAGTASAQGFRAYRPMAPVYRPYRPAVVTPAYRPAHMPGWDWWRTYPWSPYNIGRNPYNPYIMPVPYAYPYPSPYPVYTTPPVTTTSPAVTQAAAAVTNEVSVSGPLSSPPPGTALIEVRVPQSLATVRFDGEGTSSLGLERYFVTPTLEPGKNYRYVVTASWNQNGRPYTVERTVRLAAGQTVQLDFTR